VKKRSSFFRRKNSKRRKGRRGTRILYRSLLVLLLLGGAIWGGRELIFRLEIFSLQEILVDGETKTISRKEILKRVGAKTGTNLFSINLQEIHSRLGKHEFFKKISVQRSLPHSLVIRIQEFVPVFVLNSGRIYYVDEEGIIFKDITDTRDKRDYVILSGISEEEILSQPEHLKKMVQRASQLKSEYEKTQFSREFGLSEVQFQKNIGFTLFPEKKKYSIKVGNKDFSSKLQKLSQVLTKIHSSQVKFSSIDLNYPGKILMTL